MFVASILDPGQCPSIQAVTRHAHPFPCDGQTNLKNTISTFRFPAQEIIAGASKVPSIIYYDNKGRVKAIGAEAIKDGIQEAAIEGEWYKAEWYTFPGPSTLVSTDGTLSGSSFI